MQATVKTIVCEGCGKESPRRGTRQRYCVPCTKEADKRRKREWYLKNRSPIKPKEKHVCSVCGSEKEVWQFKGEHYYCKSHYHEMYNYGEIRDLRGRRKKNEYKIIDDHVEFKTTKGKTALIDFEDIDLLQNHYWGINSQGYLHSRINGNLTRLHRIIMNFPEGIIDHINRNPLDNRKENLRVTNDTGNVRNSSLSKSNTSGVVGVGKISSTGKWRARIVVDYKEINLGHFDNLEDAIAARRLAEIEYFGEYAPKWDD